MVQLMEQKVVHKMVREWYEDGTWVGADALDMAVGEELRGHPQQRARALGHGAARVLIHVQPRVSHLRAHGLCEGRRPCVGVVGVRTRRSMLFCPVLAVPKDQPAVAKVSHLGVVRDGNTLVP